MRANAAEQGVRFGQGRGLRIAMLGIDGIGKTSLASCLRDWFVSFGRECEIVSWRRLIETGACERPFPATAIRELWVEDWRLLYGGGHAGTRVIDSEIPSGFCAFSDLNIEGRFPSLVSDVRASGPLVSGLVEAALDFLIESEVVLPLASRGVSVIRESYGLKPVLKSMLIAKKCASDTLPADVVDRVVGNVASLYSDPYLQPDIGILVDGSPEVALRRRLAQDRRVGVAEDYGLAGIDGMASFLSLQEDCARIFRKLAEDWGWYRLDTGDRQPGELCTEITEALIEPLFSRSGRRQRSTEGPD